MTDSTCFAIAIVYISGTRFTCVPCRTLERWVLEMLFASFDRVGNAIQFNANYGPFAARSGQVNTSNRALRNSLEVENFRLATWSPIGEKNKTLSVEAERIGRIEGKSLGLTSDALGILKYSHACETIIDVHLISSALKIYIFIISHYWFSFNTRNVL